MRSDHSDKPETLALVLQKNKKHYISGSLITVVQVNKMRFSTAHAFLFNHVGLGMLQHGPDAYCLTASVNPSPADLSVGLLWESLARTVWRL